MNRLWASILVAVLAGCGAGRAQNGERIVRGVPLPPNIHCRDPRCSQYDVLPYARTRSRYGIGCMGDVRPGTTPDPEPPPQSYPASGIGKPGFPSLNADERATLSRIERFVHSKTLRIAWLRGDRGREFIVFDATRGPCEVGALGYKVLNGWCNEYYQPGADPYATHPAPDCFRQDEHPPWMTPTPAIRSLR